MAQPAHSALQDPPTDGDPARGRVWTWPPAESVRARPLPHLDPTTRFFVRLFAHRARRRVIQIRGLEFVHPGNDPFVVVSNHSQRAEAVILPALLMWHRNGRRIHYLADWPSMLVPGVGVMFRAAQVIPVFHKGARPAVLNRLKPWFRRGHEMSAWEQAGERLRSGASVGVFPEGTMNRHPTRLLRGRSGAAKIALENEVPIVPVGIRFPEHSGRGPIRDLDRMAIEIGPPVDTRNYGRPSRAAVRSLHTTMMLELARLSGKEWGPNGQRSKHAHTGQR